MKISRTYDPEQWHFTKEILSNGTTVLHFDNGAMASFPPLPKGEALELMTKRACEANYKILRRIAEEKLENKIKSVLRDLDKPTDCEGYYMKLKASKTSLYKLVSEYTHLPPMKKTEFKKSFRAPAYWLKWEACGVDYNAYLTACMGLPLLVISMNEYDKESGRFETISSDTHTLTVEDLRGRGMIEETKAKHPA